MRLAGLFKILFVAYTILLLNLGDSIHRAELFGIHCGACCSTSSFNPDDKGLGCECSCQSKSRGGNWPSASKALAAPGNDQGHNVCQFCDFFDHYQVVICDFTLVPSRASFFHCASVIDAQPHCVTLDASARAPPAEEVA